MRRILIIDSYYPEVIKALPLGNGTYEEELQKVLHFSFGTADFYSRNLRALGWDAEDFIANHYDLIARQPPDLYRLPAPDVYFFQNLSLISDWVKPRLVAAQCSCPWPGDEAIKRCDVVFTSFPHYIPRIAALGVKAVFNPLAFDPVVLDRIAGETVPDRIYDCVFVGGVGAPSHWHYGMKVLEAIASAIPTFQWWGYGVETLPANSALRAKYQGQAWGLDMYRIFKRSKIVINRHGEVSGSFANNMRLFEATGCGALLVTEAKDNLGDYFTSDEVVTYRSSQEAVEKIQRYLKDPEERQNIAFKGMKRVAKDHLYSKRMRTVSQVLTEMIT